MTTSINLLNTDDGNPDIIQQVVYKHWSLCYMRITGPASLARNEAEHSPSYPLSAHYLQPPPGYDSNTARQRQEVTPHPEKQVEGIEKRR